MDEKRVEKFLASTLGFGVLLSTVTLLIGGIIFLFHHGTEIPDYKVFIGEPKDLRGFAAILHDIMTWDSLTIMQLGVLIMLLTPLCRVFFCFLVYCKERDRLYSLIAIVVFVILLYCYFWEPLP